MPGPVAAGFGHSARIQRKCAVHQFCGLRAAAQAAQLPCPVYFPTPGFSTDNAAMIAAAAYPKLLRGEVADLALRAQASLSLAE